MIFKMTRTQVAVSFGHMGESTPAQESLSSIARDHRLLARALDALEVLAERLEAEATPELIADLGQFIRFFMGFAEAGHHVKEEDVLHPFLARRGFAWDSGPLREIRADHDQERYFMRVLEQAAGQDAPWSREDRRHAVATVRAFAEFQRGHQDKENRVLLPRVKEQLTGADLVELEKLLVAFDEERFGRDQTNEFVKLAEGLIQQYAPTVG
jgi:hemerythrin-like domain-containing protein